MTFTAVEKDPWIVTVDEIRRRTAAHAASANQNIEPMTVEAIKRDPWNAVILDLGNATVEVAGLASLMAGYCAWRCDEMATAAAAQAERDDWLSFADKARERAEEAKRIVSERDPPGPLTIEAIDRDPRNAIRRELPDDASPALLKRVIEAVREVRQSFETMPWTRYADEVRDAIETRERLAEQRLAATETVPRRDAANENARTAQEREKHGGAAHAPEQEKGPSHGPPRGPQPEIKPLGQTAGEMRLAWQLTKTGAQFAQAVEDRGLILVHVSREEAADSYRAREYAKAIKHQNRALKEGFAVVDRRGSVYRVDQRTTGDLWEEIQKKLGGIDRRELLSVDQARDAMKEARKAEFAEKKQAEREAAWIEQQKARPATKLEQAIIAADKKAGRDHALFAAELGEAGITLARVTASDVKALDALRKDQDLAAAAGEELRRLTIFANVREGELCVVTKLGDVLPLNQQRMADLRTFAAPAPASPSRSTEIVAGGGDPKSILALPSVTEQRAVFEIDAELLAEFWRSNTQARAIDRQAALDRRLVRLATAAAIDRQEAITGSLQEAKQGVIAVAEQGIDIGDPRRKRHSRRHRRHARKSPRLCRRLHRAAAAADPRAGAADGNRRRAASRDRGADHPARRRAGGAFPRDRGRGPRPPA